jgi:hypothetical protein
VHPSSPFSLFYFAQLPPIDSIFHGERILGLWAKGAVTIQVTQNISTFKWKESK